MCFMANSRVCKWCVKGVFKVVSRLHSFIFKEFFKGLLKLCSNCLYIALKHKGQVFD